MNRFSVILFITVIFLSIAVCSMTYTTDLDGTENPLSESDAWFHNGLDWRYVQKSGGIAFGTQTGLGGYDDSYALLSGFAPDQTITAVVHRVSGMDVSCTREVELLLRWTDAAHSAKGYECLFDQGGGIQLVRWNGAIGDFTVLNPATSGYQGPVADGDTLKASMIGNLITMYRNGVKRAELADNSYQTGNPGIGFFRRNCGNNSDYGYTSVTATDGSGTPAESRSMETPGRNLEIFPNPAASQTSIRLRGENLKSVKILDLRGRQVAAFLNEAGYRTVWEKIWTPGTLPAGVYQVRAQSDADRITRKLVIF